MGGWIVLLHDVEHLNTPSDWRQGRECAFLFHHLVSWITWYQCTYLHLKHVSTMKTRQGMTCLGYVWQHMTTGTWILRRITSSVYRLVMLAAAFVYPYQSYCFLVTYTHACTKARTLSMFTYIQIGELPDTSRMEYHQYEEAVICEEFKIFT